MKCKAFGPTGTDVPAIGQGTWNVPESGAPAREALRAIRCGIELGMTHLDTAEMYGAGRAEELVRDAIAEYPRESLFITTKVLPSNADYRGTIAAADRSLRRLGLDYVDLYLLHWPGDHPLETTMSALEHLVHEGKVRFVGVSNFDTDEMIEAASYLRTVPLACNQVLYHLNERGVEHRLVPEACARSIAIVAYTPFGRAQFPRAQTVGGRALEKVARKHGATQRQIILAFLTREPHVFTVPKAARVAHVRENAAAGDLTLEAADVAEIDAAFPRASPAPLASL